MNAARPDRNRRALLVFSAPVGTARCAVPVRVLAGGTNDRAVLAFKGVAPLHAARTSQRDVPTTQACQTKRVPCVSRATTPGSDSQPSTNNHQLTYGSASNWND